MTKLLDEAVALATTLPDNEQDRAAEILFAFTRGLDEYTIDAEQFAAAQ